MRRLAQEGTHCHSSANAGLAMCKGGAGHLQACTTRLSRSEGAHATWRQVPGCA